MISATLSRVTVGRGLAALLRDEFDPKSAKQDQQDLLVYCSGLPGVKLERLSDLLPEQGTASEHGELSWHSTTMRAKSYARPGSWSV